MSRNLCSTDCACGLWSFQTDRFFAPDDPGLLTEEEYLRQIGWADCPYRPIGRGYDGRNVGERYAWRGPPSPVHRAYSSTFVEGWEKELSARYLDVPVEDRYRFRRLDCVFCRRPYVGWYCQDPVNVLLVGVYDWADLPGFRLYDLSYWHSFNDEPSELDRAPIRQWSAEKLAALAARWNEEEGGGEGPGPESRCAVMYEMRYLSTEWLKRLKEDGWSYAGASWSKFGSHSIIVSGVQRKPDRNGRIVLMYDDGLITELVEKEVSR